MQSLPHEYSATATSTGESLVSTTIPRQPEIAIAPPEGFGGPGDIHSPEDLQVAAVASCFILSFKAIARASKLDWESLSASTRGVLDMVDRTVQFTRFDTIATLVIPPGTSREKAERLLVKAEQTCFITNSLKGESHLDIRIEGGE
jgi:peroxiredoxin-like protein